jgi:hypothetical protein
MDKLLGPTAERSLEEMAERAFYVVKAWDAAENRNVRHMLGYFRASLIKVLTDKGELEDADLRQIQKALGDLWEAYEVAERAHITVLQYNHRQGSKELVYAYARLPGLERCRTFISGMQNLGETSFFMDALRQLMQVEIRFLETSISGPEDGE